MEKLIYITQCELNGVEISSGVVEKVLSQTETFQDAFDTYLLGYTGNRIALFHGGKTQYLSTCRIKELRRFKLYTAAEKLIRQEKIACCYIRYGYSNGRFVAMLRKIKKMGTTVILEIPTFPYDLEFRHTAIHFLLKAFDRHYRNRLSGYVDKIATFSEDESIFNTPCVHIMNGIRVDDVSVRKPVNMSDTIHLIAVASMCRFHGYDRIITGLHRYYQDGGTRKVVFHLVGDGEALPGYKELAEQYHLQNQVIFHGFQSGKELDELFNSCDIAVECLGCHRKKLLLSSSLKSREYAARGLPMIASNKVDIFSENYPYLLSVPGDESPVNINEVIKFHDKIYGQQSAEQVVRSIRAFALAHCNMVYTMKPIIEAFNGNKA